MPKLLWAVFCERCVVDSTTNNLSLVNVIEELHPAPPTADQVRDAAGRTIGAAFPCALVTNWERTNVDKPESSTLRLRLADPRGKTVLEAKQQLDLKANARGRVMVNLPGMPIGVEGRYVWRFHVGSHSSWREAGRLPVLVKYLDSQKEANRLAKQAREKAAGAAKTVLVRNTAK